jgi:lysosomal acid lipase/cholesteryl ester hydrolase
VRKYNYEYVVCDSGSLFIVIRRRILNSMLIRPVFYFYFIWISTLAINKGFSDDIDSSDVTSEYNDAFLDSFGLLTKYGYSPEKHSVISEDGYILTLFRIPRKGPPVILVHGITDTSDGWLVLGPKQSLGYQLANAGFDVWLYNYRGNRYSKEHKRKISQKEYWDFSFEEMGTRDMPATIDYILNNTSRDKIHYIGFSQGTTIFFVMCSMRPEYNNKIEQAVLLAPVAWINHIKHPLVRFASNNIKLLKFLSGKGLYDLIPYSSNYPYINLRCLRKYSTEFCGTPYFLGFGLKKSSYLANMGVVNSHLPAGVATKTLLHYIQCYGSKKFQRFDYSADENMRIYSSRYPPEYNMSLITVPLSMIASESDWLSQVDDVNFLREKLTNVKRFIMIDKELEFSHIEFTYGSRVQNLVNKPILDILSQQIKHNRQFVLKYGNNLVNKLFNFNKTS